MIHIAPFGSGRARLALVGLGLIALGSAVLDPHPLRRGGVALGAVTAIAVAYREQLRVGGEVEALAGAASRLAEGDLHAPIPAVKSPPARVLATALETARASVSTRLRALEQERDGLAEYLSRADQRLCEPVADARRERLAQLDGVTVRIAVGPDRTDAALVDLTPHQGVFALPRQIARRLVPGMPVRVWISLDGEAVEAPRALAVAPAATDGDGLAEWLVRFPEPLARGPSALWEAVRGAERVAPPPGLPATATLLAPFGSVPAEVTDLSEQGVGLLVSLDPTRLGDLDRALTARLTFPTLGKMAVLSAELCNVSPSGQGVRLGLRFDRHEEDELAKVAEWLSACAALDTREAEAVRHAGDTVQ